MIGRMVRVIVESPYAGDIEMNLDYARRCLNDSLARGEAPLASHLLYPQVLDDDDPAERSLGMAAGWAWTEVAEKVIVYTDLGISRGINDGISHAHLMGLTIEYRRING